MNGTQFLNVTCLFLPSVLRAAALFIKHATSQNQPKPPTASQNHPQQPTYPKQEASVKFFIGVCK